MSRYCAECGQPEAETLPDGTCDHRFVDEPEATPITAEEQALDALLHSAYPGAIAKMRLMMENDELHGVEVQIEGGGTLRITGDALRDKLDHELGRRWTKSAEHRGRGT